MQPIFDLVCYSELNNEKSALCGFTSKIFPEGIFTLYLGYLDPVARTHMHGFFCVEFEDKSVSFLIQYKSESTAETALLNLMAAPRFEEMFSDLIKQVDLETGTKR